MLPSIRTRVFLICAVCVMATAIVVRAGSDELYEWYTNTWYYDYYYGDTGSESDMTADGVTDLRDFEYMRWLHLDTTPTAVPTRTPTGIPPTGTATPTPPIGTTPSYTPTPTITNDQLSITPSPTPISGKPYTQGRSIMVAGRELKFTGVNARGLTHYGKGDLLPYTTDAQKREVLSEMSSMGMRVARVFVSADRASSAEAAQRLKDTLALAAEYRVYLLVTFIDYYKSGFYPPTCAGSYAPDVAGYVVLRTSFFTTDYKTCYLPYVLDIVKVNASNPWVLAWELGNEIREPSSAQVYIDFGLDVARQIRAWDPTTLITTGDIVPGLFMSTDQMKMFYKAREGMDFITGRAYDKTTMNTREFGTLSPVEISALTDTPVINEEGAFKGSGRPASLDTALQTMLGTERVSGYLWWGYMASTGDNGDGDREWGMDRVFHTDYDQLKAVFTKYRSP